MTSRSETDHPARIARSSSDPSHVAALTQIVTDTPWLLEAFVAVQEVGPAGAYVAAGAIRDTVWNHITGRPSAAPYADVDVVYWNDAEPADAANTHEARLKAALPALDWEVTNQATIHLWHSRARGISVSPHATVSEGLATWPETATAVGVRLNSNGNIQVLAPFGLADLFALRLRHNPAQAGPEVFWARIEAKRWLQRWPELKVV